MSHLLIDLKNLLTSMEYNFKSWNADRGKLGKSIDIRAAILDPVSKNNPNGQNTKQQAQLQSQLVLGLDSILLDFKLSL